MLLASDLLRPRTGVFNVFQDFSERRINVLFATNVAEEGISVDDWSFVIAFDRPIHSKDFVQIKGRAHQDDSNFFAIWVTLIRWYEKLAG
jgi:superfamily II DNA/RNA helicase